MSDLIDAGPRDLPSLVREALRSSPVVPPDLDIEAVVMLLPVNWLVEPLALPGTTATVKPQSGGEEALADACRAANWIWSSDEQLQALQVGLQANGWIYTREAQG